METIGEKLANYYYGKAPENSDEYAYTVGCLSAKIDMLILDLQSAITNFKDADYHQTALYFEKIIEKLENFK